VFCLLHVSNDACVLSVAHRCHDNDDDIKRLCTIYSDVTAIDLDIVDSAVLYPKPVT
jgi:hypothetical protein